MKIMKETQWSRIQWTTQGGHRILGDSWQEKLAGSVLEETIAVSVTIWMNERAQPRQSNLSARFSSRQSVKIAESLVEECLDCRSRIISKELAITHFVKGDKGTCTSSLSERWHLPECLFYKTKGGFFFSDLEESVRMHIVKLRNILVKKNSTKNDDKRAVAMLKKYDLHDRTWKLVVNREKSHDRTGQPVAKRDTRLELKHWLVGRRSSNTQQLGCVLQDMTPPKSILRKSFDMPKPIQRVKFTKAIARHTKIRDKNPSLGYLCPSAPHQRSANAPIFEDRSQEETEWQEQGAREEAGKLDKNVIKLKEHQRATFFSSPVNRCLPASTRKLEEREFVVDFGASMHMMRKKDLSDAEKDTLTKTCSPSIVITANGEVQTHEKAIVNVKELENFLVYESLR